MNISLHGRPGDLELLKLGLLAAEYAKGPGCVSFLPSESEAVLLLGRLKFTSAKVACLYMKEKSSSTQVDEPPFFLWEKEELSPGLKVLYGESSLGKKVSLSSSALLNSTLKTYLEQRKKEPYTDLLLWADLYFLLHEPCMAKEALAALPALTTFQKEVSSYKAASKMPELLGFASAKFSEVQSRVLSSLPTPVEKPSRPSLSSSEATVIAKKWLSGYSPSSSKSSKKSPVLPVKGEKNVLVTSALPYVNNVPHLGNITGAVLSADVYARYARLRGYNTLFVCGTDEHGTTTETKAAAEGVSPREICDKYHALHSKIYEWFNVSFDVFGRTTSEKNKALTQEIFWKLHKRGYVLEDSMDQLWCESCSRFLADRFVEGICPFCKKEDARGDQCDACGKLINSIELIEPKCSSCKSLPQVKNTKHLFLDLPKLEGKLTAWLNESSLNWTNNARVIAKSWLKLGLQPRCITRDLKWGVPVPLKGYEDKVFYMWIDAPIGYIGITADYCKQWEAWWKDAENVELIQFMGKDNVPFHGIIFPCILLGSDEAWLKVNRIMSTEYLNYEETKFSKSRGIGVFGNDAQETGIPADIWRFYLTYTRPENQDSAFKWNDLLLKNNTELLNNLGNFVNRALKFCKEYFEGVICPISDKDLTEDPELLQFISDVSSQIKVYADLMEKARERDAVSSFLTVSRLGNQLMQSYTPWKRVKGSPEDKKTAHLIVSLCVNTVALLSILISPVMPSIAENIQRQVNVSPEDINSLLKTTDFVRLLPEGHVIGAPEPLISEIKDVKEFEARFGASQSDRSSVPPPASAVGDVKEVEKRVGEQGDKVRSLKASKADKKVIDAEVKVLLELKKKLAELSGTPPAPDDKKKKKSKK